MTWNLHIRYLSRLRVATKTPPEMDASPVQGALGADARLETGIRIGGLRRTRAGTPMPPGQTCALATFGEAPHRGLARRGFSVKDLAWLRFPGS